MCHHTEETGSGRMSAPSRPARNRSPQPQGSGRPSWYSAQEYRWASASSRTFQFSFASLLSSLPTASGPPASSHAREFARRGDLPRDAFRERFWTLSPPSCVPTSRGDPAVSRVWASRRVLENVTFLIRRDGGCVKVNLSRIFCASRTPDFPRRRVE